MFRKFLRKKKTKDVEENEKKKAPANTKKTKTPEKKIAQKKEKSEEKKPNVVPAKKVIKKIEEPLKPKAAPVKKVKTENEDEKFKEVNIIESDTRILTAEGWKRKKIIRK
jgi:hypothetical protein